MIRALFRKNTYSIRFLCKGINEDAKQLVRIVDFVCVLPNDPNEGGFRLGLIKLFQISAQCGYDTLVCRGVSSEDILGRHL